MAEETHWWSETSSPDDQKLISKLINDERESITSEAAAGRRDHILKSLDERGTAQALIRAQYSGRYPFELLQNSNDAAAAGDGTDAAGQVRFELTSTALLVADNGSGFGDDEVRAICGLGRSSKDPRKSIGYKGLGFKSVGEITDTPQIMSNRYWFMFDAKRARACVLERAGVMPDSQRIPVYAFPFPISPEDLGEDVARVAELFSSGFSTVIRLPLKGGVTADLVEGHLRTTLSPRLLLFLDATQTLEVRGGSFRFSAIALREEVDVHKRVLLDTNGEIEEWIVFSERLRIPDAGLTKRLGDEWKVVEEVGVSAAARLEGGHVATDRIESLHVYFPTEEVVGLPLMLSADFALELDRRHVARTPEASPYNEWLRDQLAVFLAETVAPNLTHLLPEAPTLSAFAPRVAASGFGAELMASYTERMSTSRFVPTEDGRVLLPSEVRLLPPSLPKDDRSRRFLNLESLGPIFVLEAQADEHVHHFFSEDLDCFEYDIADTLVALAPPDDMTEEFATWLVEWWRAAPWRMVADGLAQVRCVKTTDGTWLAPSDGVFFPRERDAPDLPKSLTVPIAVVPDVDGFRTLMEDAGVRPFRWREVILERLLPVLTDETSDEDERDDAFATLRRYRETERRGDQEVEARIGRMLLRAARVDGSGRTWREARSIYFSSEWLADDSLERIYGPFHQPEFLVQQPPKDDGQRRAEREFLEWIGVASAPRLDEKTAERRNVYMWNDSGRHPHQRAAREWWGAWSQLTETQSAAQCPQGHPASQQLRSSYWLDRFAELIDSKDVGRLSALFRHIAARWGVLYQSGLQATFYCQHGQHSGERERQTMSVFGFAIGSAAWIPAQRGDRLILSRPREVWRAAPDVPSRVLAVLPVLAEELDTPDGATVGQALGIVDAARPRSKDLVELLERMAAELDDEGVEPNETLQIVKAARWVMRSLDDAAAREGISAGEMTGVPLLARFKGGHCFRVGPYASDDPFLTETWSDEVPVLDADRGLSRLVAAAGLQRLEDAVSVTPRPRGISDEATEETGRFLSEALPYVAAVAAGAAPSRAETVFPRLQRLEVIVCEALELELALSGMTRTRTDATSYIAVQVRRQGRTQAAFGTAYLEKKSQSEVDWFTFGPQLAQFVDVPNLGDAFALILSSGPTRRTSYLKSRGLTDDDVAAAAKRLGQPLQPLPTVTEQQQQADQRGQVPEPADTVSRTAPSLDEPEGGVVSETPDDEDEPEYPPLDVNAIVGEDAETVVGSSLSTPLARPPGNYVDSDRDVEVHWERQARVARKIGRRGEEAVRHFERRRVESLGYEQAAVVWVSEKDETSPYDIRSIDENGQIIFIEVKSTISSDPSDPFEISAAELEFAARKGPRYWIYRVVNAGTASPRIFRFQDPLNLLSLGGASIRLSGARMRFQVRRAANDGR